MDPLIEGLQFAFYGDDFTGSTDALEALSIAGIPTVLFIGVPDHQRLTRFKHCRALGIAGESRSKSPEWMSANLPGIFGWLKQLGAPVCQYKVCSTFDSSPQIGNIGRALEIGQAVFQGPVVPIVPSAPRLGRWVVFSNLFAVAGDRVFRIDCHPSMSRHPVTPMSDGDLRVHLAKQTDQAIAGIDVRALNHDAGQSAFTACLRGHPAGILFDALDDCHIRHISDLVWRHRIPFVIGSSGFTSGVAAYLSKTVDQRSLPQPAASPVDRLIVLSGSGSPMTERQIRWAIANGFAGIRLDAAEFGDPSATGQSRDTAIRDAAEHLRQGRSVVLYSALGAADCTATTWRDVLATNMGTLLRDLVVQSGVRRVVIAGGDTSTHAGQQLGIFALTMLATLAPGAPLCLAHSNNGALTGLELVLKGGQIGREDFFAAARRGAL